METLLQCKTGRDILQLTKNFSKSTAIGCFFNIAEIEKFTVTSVVAADGKAILSLADGKSDICAITVNTTDQYLTIYSLEH